MTLLFLDTEFTDFVDCDLISIGLTDENGREFYAELTDYRREACNDFVLETVLPLLKQHKDRVEGTQWEVAKALNEWLQPYDNGTLNCVTICYDYNLDWYLMAHILRMLPEEDQPDFLNTQMIWGDLDQQALDWFWKERDCIGWKPHMALYDAHANRFAYKPLVRKRQEEQDV
jgi:hypothetical protein